jgi:hypothetical protein
MASEEAPRWPVFGYLAGCSFFGLSFEALSISLSTVSEVKRS